LLSPSAELSWCLSLVGFLAGVGLVEACWPVRCSERRFVFVVGVVVIVVVPVGPLVVWVAVPVVPLWT
jgi:hypothetical protein